MKFLLDANVLSEGMKRRPNAKVMSRLERESAECATAAPVLHELRYGIRLLAPSERRNDLERYMTEVILTLYPVLPYDAPAAEWHAAERARLCAAGRPAPYVDGAIAAIAAANDLVLVTADARGFRRFKGLQVESWAGRGTSRSIGAKSELDLRSVSERNRSPRFRRSAPAPQSG
ncbi:MAG: PIN domain-containing protein [Candidatus Binatia bacterium]